MKSFKNTQLFSVISAILLIVFGVLMILFPGTTGSIITYIVGGALLLGAVIALALYLVSLKLFNGYLLLISGALALLGTLFLVVPSYFITIITITFAVVVFVFGLGQINQAFIEQQVNYKGWLVDLILGIITAVLGVVIFVLFITGIDTNVVFYILGGTLILDGLDLFVFTVILHREVKFLLKK